MRSSTRVLVAAVVLVALAVAAVAAVPDARLTVSEVEVSPETPAPNETTTITATVSNSAGSAAGVTVDEVVLRDREDGTEYARAERLGALSVGDSVDVPLTARFEEAGVHDLELAVRATEPDSDDEDPETVAFEHPVTVAVGGVDGEVVDDVEVDARLATGMETGDGDVEVAGIDGLGGLGGLAGLGGAPAADDDDAGGDGGVFEGIPVVEAEVTNFGTATARDVVVEPSVDGEALPRRTVDDVAPGQSARAAIDVRAFDEPTEIEVVARYSLGTDRYTSETTYLYRPNRGELRLTDVDVTREGDHVRIRGNAANVGLTETDAGVIAVESAEGVEPAYPQRDYFVGTVPGSDFVTFEVTATVDAGNATAVPLSVEYVAGGEPYERTATVPIDGVPDSTPEEEGGLSWLAIGLVGVAIAGTAAVGAVYLRRRG